VLSRLFSQRSPADGRKLAKHVEIWGEILSQNRFVVRLASATVALAFLGLAVGAYGILVALYRPIAFAVSPDGQAALLGRLAEADAPRASEIRHVAKEFLRRHNAWSSDTIESDLADAFNLMTDALRADEARELARYAEKNGRTFVAFLKDQGIETTLDVRDEKTEVIEHGGKTFTVRLRGLHRTWPLHRPREDAATLEREFEALVTLVRCPRTEATPNGLLVDKVTFRTFVPDDAAEPSGRGAVKKE
jgi:hypothetical protein